MAKNVTAFVLDEEKVAVDAGGATIPGVPGIWSYDRPMLPAAVGYTLAELEEAIDILNLPLKKVTVSENKAHDTFPEQHNRLPSARETVGVAGVFGTAPHTVATDEVELLAEPDPELLDRTVDKALDIEEGEPVDG